MPISYKKIILLCAIFTAISFPNFVSAAAKCCVGYYSGSVVDCTSANTGSCSLNNSTKASYVGDWDHECSEISACPKSTTQTTEKETKIEPVVPTLQIDIPTVTFSDKVTKDGSMIGLPWLGEYISGVYKYAVSIISIFAIVMVMIGGLRWMTAGGNASAISGAKEMISGAVIGLILALGSYVVLYAINPDLVNFSNLQIELVERKPLEDIDRGEPGESFAAAENPKAISNTTYDDKFKKYAKQYNIDWRVLKAMAYMESGLDPNNINEDTGAAGLLQVMKIGKSKCTAKDAAAKKNGTAVSKECKSILDPDVNIKAGAKFTSDNFKRITRGPCGNVSKQIFFTLLYMSHNSGPGATDCATHDKCNIQTKAGDRKKNPELITKDVPTGGGCSLEKIKTGVNVFWSKHYNANAKGAGPGRGDRTYTYSIKTAAAILGLISSLSK